MTAARLKRQPPRVLYVVFTDDGMVFATLRRRPRSFVGVRYERADAAKRRR